MKLNKKLKQKIDSYFENITPEELYDKLTKKYCKNHKILKSNDKV